MRPTPPGTGVIADTLSKTSSKSTSPTSFVLDGKDQGPFRGERWNKWTNKDLSKWYLNDQKFDVIEIENKAFYERVYCDSI